MAPCGRLRACRAGRTPRHAPRQRALQGTPGRSASHSVRRSAAQDAGSFARGRELFRGGLLTEAVLAVEAEVHRQPGNVPAWLLLGTIHAENDDDLQVRPAAAPRRGRARGGHSN